MSFPVSRRRFLQGLAVASAAVPLASRVVQGQAARKVRHASFGAAGMAMSDIRGFSTHPAFELVAVADAALVAGILHDGVTTVSAIKDEMRRAGLVVRGAA